MSNSVIAASPDEIRARYRAHHGRRLAALRASVGALRAWPVVSWLLVLSAAILWLRPSAWASVPSLAAGALLMALALASFRARSRERGVFEALEARQQTVLRLAERGRPVSARVVKARDELWREGTTDAHAAVVYSFAPAVTDELLRDIARRMEALEGQLPEEPDLLAVARLARRDAGELSRRSVLPLSFTSGRVVYYGPLWVERSHLAGGRIIDPRLPCMAEPGEPCAIEHLPAEVAAFGPSPREARAGRFRRSLLSGEQLLEVAHAVRPAGLFTERRVMLVVTTERVLFVAGRPPLTEGPGALVPPLLRALAWLRSGPGETAEARLALEEDAARTLSETAADRRDPDALLAQAPGSSWLPLSAIERAEVSEPGPRPPCQGAVACVTFTTRGGLCRALYLRGVGDLLGCLSSLREALGERVTTSPSIEAMAPAAGAWPEAGRGLPEGRAA